MPSKSPAPQTSSEPFAFLAGRDPAVAAFDVMEVNPRFDPDDRTAALAAAAIVRFLFGLAARKPVAGHQ